MLIPLPPSTRVLIAGLALHLTRLPTLPVPASRRLVEEELVLVFGALEVETVSIVSLLRE